MSDKQRLKTDDVLQELQDLQGLSSNEARERQLRDLTAEVKKSALIAGETSIEDMNSAMEAILAQLEADLSEDQQNAVFDFRAVVKEQVEVNTIETSDIKIMIKAITRAEKGRRPRKAQQLADALEGRQIVVSEREDLNALYVTVDRLSKKNADNSQILGICSQLEEQLTRLMEAEKEAQTAAPTDTPAPASKTPTSIMPNPADAPAAPATFDVQALAQQILESPEVKAIREQRKQETTELRAKMDELLALKAQQEAEREARKAELRRKIGEEKQKQAAAQAKAVAEQVLAEEQRAHDESLAGLRQEMDEVTNALQSSEAEADSEEADLEAQLEQLRAGTPSPTETSTPISANIGGGNVSAMVGNAPANEPTTEGDAEDDPFASQETDRLNIQPADAPEASAAPADSGLADALDEDEEPTGEFDLSDISDISSLDDDPIFETPGRDAAVAALSKIEKLKLNENEIVMVTKFDNNFAIVMDALSESLLLEEKDYAEVAESIQEKGEKPTDDVDLGVLAADLDIILDFCAEIRASEVAPELNDLVELVKNKIQGNTDQELTNKLKEYAHGEHAFSALMNELIDNRQLNNEEDNTYLLYGVRLAVAAHTDKAPTNEILVKIYEKLNEIVEGIEAELNALDRGEEVERPTFAIRLETDGASRTPGSIPAYAAEPTQPGVETATSERDTKDLKPKQMARAQAIQELWDFTDGSEASLGDIEAMLNESTDSTGTLDRKRANSLSQEYRWLPAGTSESVFDEIETRANQILSQQTTPDVTAGMAETQEIDGIEAMARANDAKQAGVPPEMDSDDDDIRSTRQDIPGVDPAIAPAAENPYSSAITAPDHIAPARAEASAAPDSMAAQPTTVNPGAEIEAPIADAAVAREPRVPTATRRRREEEARQPAEPTTPAPAQETSQFEATLVTTLSQISKMTERKKDELIDAAGKRSALTSALRALPDVNKALGRLRKRTGASDQEIWELHVQPALTAIQA